MRKGKEAYEKVRGWFLEKEARLRILRLAYRWLPCLVAASYPACLLLCLREGQEAFARGILVPAATFLAATLFRELINCPRPYEASGILPLIPKEKQGHSFPSRHAVSAGIIAMAWGYQNPAAGIAFWVVAVIIAASRVLAGVHYVRDVAAGLALAAAAGLAGFYL